MIQYGKHKRGSAKLHLHNECGICSENHVSKSNERFESKQIMEQALIETFRNISRETFEKAVQAIFDN